MFGPCSLQSMNKELYWSLCRVFMVHSHFPQRVPVRGTKERKEKKASNKKAAQLACVTFNPQLCETSVSSRNDIMVDIMIKCIKCHSCSLSASA